MLAIQLTGLYLVQYKVHTHVLPVFESTAIKIVIIKSKESIGSKDVINDPLSQTHTFSSVANIVCL